MYTSSPRTAAAILLALPLTDAERCGDTPEQDARVSHFLTQMYAVYVDGGTVSDWGGALHVLYDHDTLATAWRRVRATVAQAKDLGAHGFWLQCRAALHSALVAHEAAG